MVIMSILFFFGCSSSRDLATVKKVDLQKYSGLWYEIARLPNNFEEGLECITAEYSINDNGTIKVTNKGRSIKKNGKLNTAVGIAKVSNPAEPGRLKVSFFRPFWGKYYIFYLDENYKIALVGNPSRNYFWMLSRTKSFPESELKSLIDIAKKEGFDTSKLLFPNQDCQ